MLEQTATSLVDMISSGETTAEYVIEQTIKQIEDTSQIHAFLHVNKGAVQQAKEIDRRIKEGRRVGRLAGIPVSIKDNICTKQYPTTCASRMLDGYTPPYDATVIRRLLDEDAIIIGKTNMDEFAMGLSTEFSAYGPTLNPHNPDIVPGGSSGGSAASVATHTSTISLGSDTGGSVRNPASFCGVVGFKPTYGMISRYGLISYANSIEQIGPMAKSISDISLCMSVIAGPDRNDNTTAGLTSVLFTDTHDVAKNPKVGIVRQMASNDNRIQNVLDKAVERLSAHGCTCEEVSLEMVDYSVAAYYTITSTEAASNLARYDNIRYGYNMDHTGYEYHQYITKARAMFGAEVKRRIIAGGFVPSAGYAGRYFLKALKVKSRLTREIDKMFESYDYLISVTVPILPFRMGEKVDDPVSMFLVDMNTVTANLTGKPAISIPYGMVDGLPVGVQMMANTTEDAKLLQFAQILEEGHTQ
ncbi:MAG: Asp-tRNA(Asn)/Glu-tRNA(Gln) amidotransferase subunit GatA [Cenarchaeum sp. SB0665_bin_23]|nr:Asp-tRNA(Asn)/Glu-tRNA(Gln) amidotransferase subunit GatA [Cenarchaeum sp. SB0667_bin_13]MXY60754.1 Asp-tRNA(Asn)/Glu-tRNA(Gln) amidotransferase subunit GatA [Cenarchaeum sp. SB0665_bin_23]MXZ93680.1 Asp-tRNA(Asn)/Glu-tRNA(Gln) amidotransferase subunit GatA [Cenarchaeum sp. SB0666_bin_15]MYB47262.1 Asp-tRNA(Asn)/Glu-tRNA(Gln) amidotransferase subunit GatA [Cenarchaeum sp. SB0662_bin_33]MYC79333.1 Asp-tRNA(Asn)/Glu-tRNA(Gln) amidotransferase subunit GatA [Cenarchaeum sp. SB0661_bin_35]MYD582